MLTILWNQISGIDDSGPVPDYTVKHGVPERKEPDRDLFLEQLMQDDCDLLEIVVASVVKGHFHGQTQ